MTPVFLHLAADKKRLSKLLPFLCAFSVFAETRIHTLGQQEDQSQPWLQSKFDTIPGYKRPFLKNNKGFFFVAFGVFLVCLLACLLTFFSFFETGFLCVVLAVLEVSQ